MRFVLIPIDKAGGVANVREAARKTIPLVGRRQASKLPDVDDMADNLGNYLRTVESDEEVDEKIAKTDDLIDEIVYELYKLTDGEIEIVEEATTDQVASCGRDYCANLYHSV